jgi:hypothetical protein
MEGQSNDESSSKGELGNSGPLLGLLSDSGDSLSAYLLSRSADRERERETKVPRLSLSATQERALLEGLRANSSGQSSPSFAATSFIEFMTQSRGAEGFSWHVSDDVPVGLDDTSDGMKGDHSHSSNKPFSLSDLRLSFGQSRDSATGTSGYTFDVEELNQLLIEGKICIDSQQGLSLSQEFQAIRNKSLLGNNGDNEDTPTLDHNNNSSNNNNQTNNNSNNNSTNNNNNTSNNSNNNSNAGSSKASAAPRQKEEKATGGRREPKRTFVKKVNGIPVKLDDQNNVFEELDSPNTNSSNNNTSSPANTQSASKTSYAAISANSASGFSSSFVSPTALGNFLYDPNNSSQAMMSKNSATVGKQSQSTAPFVAPTNPAQLAKPITYSKLAMIDQSALLASPYQGQALTQQQQQQALTTSENMYAF